MNFAHSTDNPDRSDWQGLVDHLRSVADLAAARGDKFGAGAAAALAGWLHDVGKYSEEFQLYIRGRRPGGVDHSTAGARVALELSRAGKGSDRVIADLVAYAVAGHHAGLPDRRPGAASLETRVKTAVAPLDPIWKSQIALAATGLFPAGFHWHADNARKFFQLAILGRMIFSCLIDADRIDTERFYARIEGRPVDRGWPRLPNILPRLISAFDAHMAEKQAGAAPTPVNRLRADILAAVRAKATAARGIFTLSVPTGGGKTLASLGFALDHARHHGMHRIVTAIPFTGARIETSSRRSR